MSTDLEMATSGAGGTDDGTRSGPVEWPLWQRIVFRFFFIYLLLQIAPWNWFAQLPGMGVVAGTWYRVTNAAVQFSNRWIFHGWDTLVPMNGSGDTSWAWTQLWLYLSVALVGCAVWSLVDRRRRSYSRAAYWLRTITRYYIALAALRYGIIKLFSLQMPFPSTSQLATPLGDLLPMRLSWLFIGYSTKYQFFSGLMETTAGLLLLWRRTVTLGLFAAAGAFLNVVMINMSYDVPVKLYASHLLLACTFLLLWDGKRLFTLLVLNRPVTGTPLYDPPFRNVFLRVGALAVKAVFIVYMLVFPFRDSWRRYHAIANAQPTGPFPAGMYTVRQFVLNGDTIPAGAPENMRWRDVIFDNGGSGSVGTTDTLFWQRYHRGYFRFRADTTEHTADVWKTSAALDSTYLFRMRYEMPDTATLRLWTATSDDSLFVELVRMDRHFQLTERQFHWLSEYNR
jgi:hypothetical protein